MSKGFTLIELLIVIGILAILATTVVLVLNPAQILAESRDTQRISDMGSVQSAIGLVLATAANPTAAFNFGWGPYCTVGTTSGFSTTTACTTRALRNVDGTGWVSINLGASSSGAPLAALPIDPTNSGSLYYTYVAATGPVYEINGRLESTKLASTTMANDGGDDNNCGTSITAVDCWYEIGTDPGLNL